MQRFPCEMKPKQNCLGFAPRPVWTDDTVGWYCNTVVKTE